MIGQSLTLNSLTPDRCIKCCCSVRVFLSIGVTTFGDKTSFMLYPIISYCSAEAALASQMMAEHAPAHDERDLTMIIASHVCCTPVVDRVTD
jgi:hypothetical protein